jgi:hypothetical protein
MNNEFQENVEGTGRSVVETLISLFAELSAKNYNNQSDLPIKALAVIS